MREAFKVFAEVKNYKSNVFLVILFNILLSVFTVVSIPVLIPFFQLLFNRNAQVDASSNALIDRMNQYFLQIIDTQGREQALITVCLVIMVIFLLKNLFRYLAVYFMAPVRTGLVHDLRERLYNKYLSLPYGEYLDLKTGDLISRIIADIQEVESSIFRMIEVVFKAPLIIIGSIAFMIFISPQLTLFVLALLLFTIFIIGGISKTLKKKSSKVQGYLGNITSQVEETVSAMKIIKVFNGQERQFEKFDQENKGYRNTLLRLIRRRELASPLSEFLGVSIVLLLMWFGARLVFKGELLPETFFAFIVAFYQVIEPAKSFSNAYFHIQKGLAAHDRVEDFLALSEEQLSDDNKRSIEFSDQLSLQNISFAYPNGIEVLKDINIDVHKGETIALVGPSGGGKTTLIDLIAKVHELQSGIMKLDGIDSKEISLSNWRSLFGIVTQSPILFHDTVLANINFSGRATKDKVIEAAKIANAHEFIMKLPDGYHTIIGDKGMKLSGGQRQRLTIARAILTDPEILILDEATSSLDSESERLVQEALERITKDRTAIIIAHRLSTIVNADKIYVMIDGKIADQGTHQALSLSSETYSNLVAMQSV